MRVSIARTSARNNTLMRSFFTVDDHGHCLPVRLSPVGCSFQFGRTSTRLPLHIDLGDVCGNGISKLVFAILSAVAENARSGTRAPSLESWRSLDGRTEEGRGRLWSRAETGDA
jgi:hypothetical protein